VLRFGFLGGNISVASSYFLLVRYLWWAYVLLDVAFWLRHCSWFLLMEIGGMISFHQKKKSPIAFDLAKK
jgi:hypothetical protein